MLSPSLPFSSFSPISLSPLLSSQDAGAGLCAAVMIAIVPGYISRSVAGSYDNEGIAIFCMILTYLLWIKSVKTGSMFWSTFCSLAYFYMVKINENLLMHVHDRLCLFLFLPP